jgi:type I restriction enzyme S subunit
MKPVTDLNIRFGYWLLRHITQLAIDSSRGVAGMLHITKGMMEGFECNLPPLPEQEKIVAQLDAIAERTHALEATTATQLEQLKALKASLLDAAFRGQL